MKQLILFLSLFVFLMAPFSKAEARKKRKYSARKWSVSMVNGYSFYQAKKSSADRPGEWLLTGEGQMHSFFSALELSRNFGHFEMGAKIQNKGSAFVSPFVKGNFNKNNSRASIIPSVTFGLVPSNGLFGSWLRASLGLSVNRYMSLEPFVGTYAWLKVKDNPKYEKYNWHLHTGLKINLYY